MSVRSLCKQIFDFAISNNIFYLKGKKYKKNFVKDELKRTSRAFSRDIKRLPLITMAGATSVRGIKTF